MEHQHNLLKIKQAELQLAELVHPDHAAIQEMRRNQEKLKAESDIEITKKNMEAIKKTSSQNIMPDFTLSYAHSVSQPLPKKE